MKQIFALLFWLTLSVNSFSQTIIDGGNNDYTFENIATFFSQAASIENYCNQSTRSGQTFVNSEMVRTRVFDSSNQSSAQCDVMNENGTFKAYLYAQDNAGNHTSFECRTDTAYIVTPSIVSVTAQIGDFVKLINNNTGAIEYSSLPMGIAVADATSTSDIVTQFNALLASLRAAGYIAP